MPGTTIREQIEKLETALRTVLTSVKAPALDAAALDTIESRVGTLTADMKAFWTWGLGPQVFGRHDLGMDGEATWLSVEEAAVQLVALREIPAFPRSFVPLASDDAGNFRCFDNETGSVTDWDHETRTHRLMSKTLVAYLEPRRVKVERAARERARADKDKGKLAKAADAVPAGALPRGLRKVTSPLLTRFDSKGYAGGMQRAALSLDGRFMAFGSSSNTYIFDVRAEKIIDVDRWGASAVLAFDPCSPRVMSCCGWQAQLLDVTGTATHHWEVPGTPTRGGFSHDGELVFLLEQTHGLSVWRTADLPKPTKKPKKATPFTTLTTTKNSGYFVDVSVAKSNTILVLRDCSDEHELTLFDPATKKTLASVLRAGRGKAAALTSDGQRAAVGTKDGDIFILTGDGLELQNEIKGAHAKDSVYSLAFDPSGRVLVSSGEKELAMWDAATGKRIAKESASSKNYLPKLHVSTVTTANVLTCEPLALFEMA